MAKLAEQAVWRISSEKTLGQILALDERAQEIEDQRTSELVVEESVAPEAASRRSSRDQYAFLRAELARPEDDPQDPHYPWRYSSKRLRHELSPGTSAEVLATVEERISLKLPPSYWDFSLEWCGGQFYTTGDGSFRVIPATEILNEVRGPLCDRMTRPFLPIVDLGCGDYLALDMSKSNRAGEHPVYWWYGGDVKKKVADSFALWLKKLVESSGEPYWWDG